MDHHYRGILTRADDHFRTVSTEQPDALTCRKGCNLCCHGLFEIGSADVTLIAEGLSLLPAPILREVEKRAAEVFESTLHPYLRDISEEEKEAFFDRAGDTPCPNLDANGACLIYDSRPIICRTFGLPIRNGSTFLGEECELNFGEATLEDREKAAWDLQWEDVLGPEDVFTIPEAILLASRMRGGAK